MIVTISSGGRLGNQLMFAANLMATSIEYDIPYQNIAFEAGQFFVCESTVSGVRNVYNKTIYKILNFYFWKMKKVLHKCPGVVEIIDNENQAVEFFTLFGKKKGIKLLHCWPYLDYASLYKHQNQIRAQLYPKKEYLQEVDAVACELGLDRAEVLVGIHIRMEDYVRWMDGRYFFEQIVYKSRMDEIAALYPDKRIVFVVFSNGEIDKRAFTNDKYDVVYSNGTAIVDMILMSRCNLLVGPPSTFSGWASFMGAVPRYIMLDRDTSINSLDCFGVYMIDNMDNRLTQDGYKILSKLSEGKVVA